MMEPVDTVARTIWGEARSCGAAGMRHVASVIANRVSDPCWWGHDWVSVCEAPSQFSCRNPGDPNRVKLLAVTDADPEFRLALGVARAAVGGTLADETHGADSYYAILSPAPRWVASARHTLSDGWHAFYVTRPPQPKATQE